MKKTLQCPKCDSRKLWRIETMQERGQYDRPAPLGVTMAERRWGKAQESVGKFETFICAGCGYTEWYAHDAAALKADPKNGVHFIDDEPEGGLR